MSHALKTTGNLCLHEQNAPTCHCSSGKAKGHSRNWLSRLPLSVKAFTILALLLFGVQLWTATLPNQARPSVGATQGRGAVAMGAAAAPFCGTPLMVFEHFGI